MPLQKETYVASELTVGPCNAEDLATFLPIANDAFAVSDEQGARYGALVGQENFRVIRSGGRIVGGLAALPFGQYFGGRVVPAPGIAAVAVDPTFRAQGAASTLLRAVLTEMHAAGVAISSLYPATIALYRRAGYEIAGLKHDVRLAAKFIDLRERNVALRAATEADTPAIHALYAVWAAGTNGNLDRLAFNWQRVDNWRDAPTRCYVVEEEGQLTGYIKIAAEPNTNPGNNIRVADVAFTTRAAGARLWTLLADYRTVRDDIVLTTGPADPWLHLLSEARYRITAQTPWMLRIVSVPAALAARGYPLGLTARIEFRVHDDVLAENAGPWVLEIADGVGRASRGGQGEFEIDIRGLAALYTGLLTPQDLVYAGRAAGSPAVLARVAPVFAGAAPWMRDGF